MKIHPDLKPGSKFPDFELPDHEGEVFKLTQVMRGWPTVEELRMDLRALMARRSDYAYDRAWDDSEEAREGAFF